MLRKSPRSAWRLTTTACVPCVFRPPHRCQTGRSGASQCYGGYRGIPKKEQLFLYFFLNPCGGHHSSSFITSLSIIHHHSSKEWHQTMQCNGKCATSTDQPVWWLSSRPIQWPCLTPNSIPLSPWAGQNWMAKFTGHSCSNVAVKIFHS